MIDADFRSLLPPTATATADGITIGGVPLVAVAERFGTPSYVIDEQSLREQIGSFRDALARRWGAGRVHFASKAFPTTAMYRVMAEEGIGVDVAGGGELHLALRAGVRPDVILLHGNAKTDEEISLALEAGVGLVVIDNFDDIDRLERLAPGRQSVLVRVRPDVVAPTHEAMATGHASSKFGLSIPDARRAIERITRSRHLGLEGLHVHIGSQISELAPFTHAVEALADLGEFDTYDLGGGLAARYTYGDHAPSPDEWVETLTEAARRVLPAHARILLEPGRSVVARAGVTLYRVVTVKHGEPTFVAVDGGMGDNLDVSLYGQRFESAVVTRPSGGGPVDLVGRHCESGDRLVEGARLNDPRPGDLIVVAVTGAYCVTMANNYNGARRPPVVFVRDGVATLRQRRETYEDLASRDV